MTVSVQVLEEPTLVFTRHRNLRTQGVPQGNRSHSEFQYDAVLKSFGDQAVAFGLSAGFSKVNPQLGWWETVPDDQQPEAELSLLVEDYCFCAGDPLGPVETKWKLRATLTDLNSNEVIWQDCLDWTMPGDGVSMDQLNRADPDRRSEFLNEVLTQLAGRLAEHLASQR